MKNKNEFKQLLRAADLRQLFISNMGWNKPQGQTRLPLYVVDEKQFDIQVVAQRNGFQILTANVDEIPKISLARKLDAKLRRQANDYILVLRIPDSEHQAWLCPVRNAEKRELVAVEYGDLKQADFLFSKMDGLIFENDEVTTILDVKERVQKAFAVNSEKITKDFYAGFRKEHKAFAAFIQGIDADRDKQWYTSVMLNRLMFCYFIQKKGFLNGDVDYLTHKLAEVRNLRGENKFYQTFYLDFLVQLFHDGLNSPKHTPEFVATYGRIPYLNGGMFDTHQLEQQYAGIDIPDEAFERLFAFFDTWQWHLDTRITASGKDINPDVLGYIFEQYINDRAAMGAYYTKEDITEYISKNCILPFLFDQVAQSPSSDAFKPAGEVWARLRQSGMRYVYDAVKKGHSSDWQQLIPSNIAQGIDTAQPHLLERRKDWNTPTAEAFALPTEIWRETIERLQRCDALAEKIASGSITTINDFITLNLNIRLFAEDLLAQTQDHHLVAHFYKALRSVTILDPTCGSGAFLFAAMGILEPLYETCILRMQEFNATNPKLFKDELGEIDRKYRSNIQYFIYKSIILRNLYGVDIMVEATEIAKLRLFLKMVAVVEVDPRADNMGLDPLPDIDFNIRCGNTLVGYATKEELEKNFFMQNKDSGDMFAELEFREKVETEMRVVATAYNTFKQLQMVQEDDMIAFKQAKQQLRERLSALNDLLNRHMYAEADVAYETWLQNTQPFHWLAEFYDIMQGNGGFDVIIGNPPYVEVRQINYSLPAYKTLESGAVHAMCIERSLELLNSSGNVSMIVPLALVCTQRMKSVQCLLESNRCTWYSNFSWRPAKLFDAVNRALTIFVSNKSNSYGAYTTNYMKWTSDNRSILLQQVYYTQYTGQRDSFWVPKLSGTKDESILCKILQHNHSVVTYSVQSSLHNVYYRTTGGLYWKVFTNFSPKYTCNGVEGKSSRETTIKLGTEKEVVCFLAILSSNLFWMWYTLTSNLRDLNPSDIAGFKVTEEIVASTDLYDLGKKYIEDLKRNSSMLTREQKGKGTTQTQSFKISLSKPIIDEIDKVLAKHYGFTDEELDFIINYDIKYRMGDELNAE